MADEELLEWCRRGGVVAAGVMAAAVREGGRGLVATRELEPGACVLRVPQALLMSAHSAARDPQLASALQQHGAGLSSEQVLAAHLLCELAKVPASFWAAYLQSLPRSYSTAACFAPADIEALQAQHAQQAVRGAALAVEEGWRGAAPLLRAVGLPAKFRSLRAWQWAASTLSSRTMYLPSNAAGALTPLGDFANYQPPPPPLVPDLPAALALEGCDAGAGGACQWAPCGSGKQRGERQGAVRQGAEQQPQQQQEKQPRQQLQEAPASQQEDICGDGRLDEVAGEYCLYTHVRCKPGDQVFLCYGRHTNLELLVSYGFVLPSNPHDTAALPPELLPPEVVARLGSAGGADGQGAGAACCECYVHQCGAPSWGLLRALRLAVAAPEERRSLAHLALEDRPISASSERAALVTLRQACCRALAQLPTTPEQDEELLAGHVCSGADRGQRQQQLGQCGWLAVEWRLCYKQALRRAIALADRALAALGPGVLPAAVPAGVAALVRRPKLC